LDYVRWEGEARIQREDGFARMGHDLVLKFGNRITLWQFKNGLEVKN